MSKAMVKSSTKIFIVFCATLMLLISLMPMITASAQDQQSDFLNLEVHTLDKDKYDELINENEYLSQKVKEIKEQDYNVSTDVQVVENHYVITYSNDSETTVGMIQLSGELNSSLEISLKEDRSLDHLTFEEEGKTPVTIDESEVLYESPTLETQDQNHNVAIQSRVSDSTKSKICSIVTSLSSLATGTVYGAVASGIGVHYAVAVAIVNAIGWGYISSHC